MSGADDRIEKSQLNVGLDHVVVLVRGELDAAVASYKAMGF